MSQYNVTLDGVTYEVNLLKKNGDEISFSIDGQNYDLRVTRPLSETRTVNSVRTAIPRGPVSAGPVSQTAPTLREAGDVTAPIPGILSSIKVSIGDQVSVGDTIAIIEAMKMENPIRANCSGKVAQVYGKAGDEVKVGTSLIKVVDTQ